MILSLIKQTFAVKKKVWFLIWFRYPQTSVYTVYYIVRQRTFSHRIVLPRCTLRCSYFEQCQKFVSGAHTSMHRPPRHRESSKPKQTLDSLHPNFLRPWLTRSLSSSRTGARLLWTIVKIYKILSRLAVFIYPVPLRFWSFPLRKMIEWSVMNLMRHFLNLFFISSFECSFQLVWLV